MGSLDKKWVHIDLKGMAPTVKALLASIERFTSWGINGFVFELEDMFPFKGADQSIRTDCYTREEWQSVAEACRSHGAECIPLIQTLGHLEWLLWHDDFAHLRLADEGNDGVSGGAHNIYQMQPCLEQGIDLIIELIQEVISLFGDLKYLHIGGDETNFKGEDPGQDYLKHMLPIMNAVISKGIKPIIWSDMVLHYFEIIKDVPDEVIFADWIYAKRKQIDQEPTKPNIWGEVVSSLDQLSEKRKNEFSEHIYRGLDPGGEKHRLYPFPSYFKSKGRKCIVVPAAQCHRDSFTHPTLYWKFDNARSYCREGYENDALGALNSDWIVRRVPREQTMICHYGFAKTASDMDNPPSNTDIIRNYWNEIYEGAGEKAVELFDRIGEVRGDFYDETKPLKHRDDSTQWEIDSLHKRVEDPAYRPGDLDETDEKVKLNSELVNAGKDIAAFCESLLPSAAENRKPEVEGWRLGGLQISFRARVWMFLRDRQNGADVSGRAQDLISEAERLEQEFRDAWKDRYLESDIDFEMQWRFRDVVKFLQS